MGSLSNEQSSEVPTVSDQNSQQWAIGSLSNGQSSERPVTVHLYCDEDRFLEHIDVLRTTITYLQFRRFSAAGRAIIKIC